MDFFADIFEYRFLLHAMLAAIMSGIVCGMVGTYVACRRLIFLSGGITHSSFGGIGIAYYIGANPIAGAFIFAVLSALGIEWAADKGRMREDSAIGIVWSVGMAVGIIFIYLTPGYAPNLMSFLFGSILTVTKTDILALGALTVVVLLLFGFLTRHVFFAAFDREYAQSQGVPVRFISYAMSVLIAMTIVFSIRSVGIVLLISLLTFPAVIVNALTKDYRRIIPWAAAVAVAGNITGLWISYRLDIPAGAATIFVLTLTLIITKLLPLRGAKQPHPRHEEN